MDVFQIAYSYPAFDRLRLQAVLKSRWLWLGLIFAVGTALRFYRIDAMSLWSDEALQYQIASAGSLAEVIRGAMTYANPPLSQIINYFFLQAGKSDFFLRLPSVLFGIASIPVFHLVATKITSQRTALIATTMFALSPFHLWYSHDARQYAQLIFFSLLSTHFLFTALDRGGLARWTAYVLAVIAGFATQVFMGFVFAAHMTWVITCHRDRLKPYLAAAAGIVLPFVWLLPFFVRSFIAASIKEHQRWEVTAAKLPYTFFNYSAGFSFGPRIRDLHLDGILDGLAQFAPSILSVALIFGTLFILGIRAFKKNIWQQGRALCLYTICLTISGTALYALCIKFEVRYTVAAFPFFCVLVSAGLDSLWCKKEFWGAVFAFGMACIIGLSVYNYFENERYFNPDVRSAVAYWKQLSDQEPLLSNSDRVVSRYINGTNKERFHAISNSLDQIDNVSSYFDREEYSLVHVLILKKNDWAFSFEKELRNNWKIAAEKRFHGVVLISIIAGKRLYL